MRTQLRTSWALGADANFSCTTAASYARFYHSVFTSRWFARSWGQGRMAALVWIAVWTCLRSFNLPPGRTSGWRLIKQFVFRTGLPFIWSQDIFVDPIGEVCSSMQPGEIRRILPTGVEIPPSKQDKNPTKCFSGGRTRRNPDTGLNAEKAGVGAEN